MDIGTMRKYVRLARTLNFTRTAQEFFITQPTLSRHLSNMEKELGATLILRSTHDAELTEEGLAVAAALEDIIARYDEMAVQVDRIRKSASGHIVLGFLYYGGMGYLREGLGAFAESSVGVGVEFLSQQPYQVVEGLLDGALDVGLVFQVDALPERDFQFIPVHDSKVFAYLPEGHRLTSRDSIQPSELDGERLVLTMVDEHYNKAMLDLAERLGIDALPDRCCPQIDLFAQAVTSSGGFLLGTSYMPISLGDKIVRVPIEHGPSMLVMGLYHRRGNTNPALPKFLAQWR